MPLFQRLLLIAVPLLLLSTKVSAQPLRYDVRLLPEVPGASITVPVSMNDHGFSALIGVVDFQGFAHYTDGTSLFRIPGLANEGDGNSVTFVNNANEFFGTGFIEDGTGLPPPTPYVRSGGVTQILPLPPGTVGAVPTGANENGLAVGSSFGNLPVLWDRVTGSASIVTLPGLYQGHLKRVNNAGLAVGVWTDFSLTNRGLVYDEQGARSLPGFGGNATNAYDVNSSGMIVGYSNAPSGPLRGALWVNEQISLIPGLSGSVYDLLLGINDSGLIIGASSFDGENETPFIHVGNETFALPSLLRNTPPGFEGVSVIADINNHGNLLGFALVDGRVVPAEYILVPSAGTGVVGLLGLTLLVRRQR